MTLFIAVLLIAGFGFHWSLYVAAVILWLMHLGYGRRIESAVKD